MSDLDIVAALSDVEPRLPELRFVHPVSWTIRKGEQWAVVGPNGAGKTLLADFLQRKHAFKSGHLWLAPTEHGETTIRSIAFKDIYSLTDVRNTYYQQRWQATEVEESAVVADLIGENISDDAKHILARFRFEEQLHKRLLYLSSGELRKLLVIRALLTHPDLLILDNPYIGLDVESRLALTTLLEEVVALRQTQIVLLVSSPKDIPSMISHILPVKEKQCLPTRVRDDFLSDPCLIQSLFPEETDIPPFPEIDGSPSDHKMTLRMENVNIRYGNRTILNQLNWEIRNGEKWSLSGANGAGKSTLLSLVCADNPQSYANCFFLFDKKRGSGESIWDIKQRIGYVSPEMHLYYQENVAALQIVGSGFFDSIGLFRKCSEAQLAIASRWMEIFGVAHLSERLFLTLSTGEQRLVLLARAFVKIPDLLVLDEPLHGLDRSKKHRVKKIIEQYCALPGKTLIYVTHYPEELPSCVNKQLVLKKIKDEKVEI